MRQPVCQCLRGHVAGVGKRKQMAVIQQLVRARIDDQQRGNAFQLVDAVMPGDLLVLVEAADIDRHHLIMALEEGSDLRQFENAGKHTAVGAPVTAQVDQKAFALRLCASLCTRDLPIRIGIFGIGQRQWLVQSIQAGDGHARRLGSLALRRSESPDGDEGGYKGGTLHLMVLIDQGDVGIDVWEMSE